MEINKIQVDGQEYSLAGSGSNGGKFIIIELNDLMTEQQIERKIMNTIEPFFGTKNNILENISTNTIAIKMSYYSMPEYIDYWYMTPYAVYDHRDLNGTTMTDIKLMSYDMNVRFTIVSINNSMSHVIFDS